MGTDYLTLIDRSICYDADTGEFFWRVSPSSRIRRGRPAGTVTKEDTLRIGVGGRYFLGHDIAWFLGHGEWPPAPVVHANGDTLDNRLDNLALITDCATAPPSPLPCLRPAVWRPGVRG